MVIWLLSRASGQLIEEDKTYLQAFTSYSFPAVNFASEKHRSEKGLQMLLEWVLIYATRYSNSIFSSSFQKLGPLHGRTASLLFLHRTCPWSPESGMTLVSIFPSLFPTLFTIQLFIDPVGQDPCVWLYMMGILPHITSHHITKFITFTFLL